ncbi:MAG TPA: hypothetical protein VMW38_29670 [Terriglobia bacterium]|nr:hypothetical protein [Terriglobia bacterium]
MKTDLENELPLKSYLLGELRPEDQQRLEQRLMIDTAVFDELQRVEEELIDDYLKGALSGRQKESFESFFLLPPERRQKLTFARELRRYIAEHAPRKARWSNWWESWTSVWRVQNPIPAWSLAAAILLILVGGSWSVVRIFTLQKEIEQARVPELQKRLAETQDRNVELTARLQHEQNQRGLLEQEVANLRTGEKPSRLSLLPGQTQPVFAFFLTPSLRGLGSSQKLSIPSGTNLVQLELNFAPEDYARYRATVQRVDGEEIWSQSWLKAEPAARSQLLRLILPAKLLTPGDYAVSLSGISASGESENAGKYYFRVVRK